MLTKKTRLKHYSALKENIVCELILVVLGKDGEDVYICNFLKKKFNKRAKEKIRSLDKRGFVSLTRIYPELKLIAPTASCPYIWDFEADSMTEANLLRFMLVRLMIELCKDSRK